jgi:hypothetical protein
MVYGRVWTGCGGNMGHGYVCYPAGGLSYAPDSAMKFASLLIPSVDARMSESCMLPLASSSMCQ